MKIEFLLRNNEEENDLHYAKYPPSFNFLKTYEHIMNSILYFFLIHQEKTSLNVLYFSQIT